MKKIIIVFFCIFLLIGCVQKQVNLKINNDLSSSIIFSIKYEGEDDKTPISNIFKDIRKEALRRGYVVINKTVNQDYQDNSFNASKYFSRYDLLKGNLTNELKINGIDINVVTIKDQKASKLLLEGNIKTYSSRSDLNISNFGKYFMEDLNEFTISLPYKTDKHNAEYIRDYGKTLIWKIFDSIDENIFVELNITEPYDLNLLILLFIVVSFIGLSFLLKRNLLKSY